MRWIWLALAVLAGGTVALRDGGTEPGACRGFGFPVGPPDAHGYYDAQAFGRNDHLGNDWNGNGGGDTDLGDPVHAIGAGVITVAHDHGGGWGKVVRIVHGCGDGAGDQVESLYAHLDAIEVHLGQRVASGERIGTIGTAGGQYLAHLHLELRAHAGLPLGGGYSTDSAGYLDPTAFIERHR
jgi:murein DD-endopeptidase MepM/ murein hydrolase activator NlpD